MRPHSSIPAWIQAIPGWAWLLAAITLIFMWASTLVFLSRVVA